VDDLEEMMMMEAIRLSLASEEERRKKEEKDAKKEAKKKEKESKKAGKAARKNSLFTLNSNNSSVDQSSVQMERSRSNLSMSLGQDDDSTASKGKGIERTETPPVNGAPIEEEIPRPSYLPALSLSQSGTSQESLASSIPFPAAAEPLRRSHLRQMSNASSTSSSFVEAGPAASFGGSGTPPPGSLEPMFNFRSLAAMIGEDEKDEDSSHVEEASRSRSPLYRADSLDDAPLLSKVSSGEDGSSMIATDSLTRNTTHASEATLADSKAAPYVEATRAVSHV
jgi:hypothetical protein